MSKLIQAVDIVDLIHFVDKKNKTFQAIVLQQVEEVLDKNSPEYKEVRKAILDGFNNYTRSYLKVIFGGDIEYLIK